jgi:hypothetical protein
MSNIRNKSNICNMRGYFGKGGQDGHASKCGRKPETTAQVIEIPELNQHPQFSLDDARGKIESAFSLDWRGREIRVAGFRKRTMQHRSNRKVTSPHNEQHLQHPGKRAGGRGGRGRSQIMFPEFYLY